MLLLQRESVDPTSKLRCCKNYPILILSSLYEKLGAVAMGLRIRIGNYPAGLRCFAGDIHQIIIAHTTLADNIMNIWTLM